MIFILAKTIITRIYYKFYNMLIYYYNLFEYTTKMDGGGMNILIKSSVVGLAMVTLGLSSGCMVSESEGYNSSYYNSYGSTGYVNSSPVYYSSYYSEYDNDVSYLSVSDGVNYY